MSKLSPDQTRAIESSLQEAGAVLPCPRCGCADSSVLDGYLIEHAQLQLRNLVISGDNCVSCIATVCSECGYLAQHVLGVLATDQA